MSLFAKRKTVTNSQKRVRTDHKNETGDIKKPCVSEKEEPKPQNDTTDRGKDKPKDVVKPETKLEKPNVKDDHKKNAIATSSAATIRASHRMDYQRDICTQFLKTGRCRYGDSCKFLHEREGMAEKSNVNTRWKENKAKATKDTGKVEQHACAICDRDPPQEAVRSQCSHSYCQSCFVNAAKSHEKCHVCGVPTSGSAEVV